MFALTASPIAITGAAPGTIDFGGTALNTMKTTLVTVTDEPGYVNALNQLRSLFDRAGMQDAKINFYRVLAGRTNHSHRVTINTPSQERLAALLDWVGTDPQMAEWLASSAKFRTVVSNSTAREITK